MIVTTEMYGINVSGKIKTTQLPNVTKRVA
jgi:hypothetical protein